MMMKGGARARSGPAPDPESLTQAEGEWTVLPAEGRSGDAPPWPLAQAIERELDIWADEWTRPQAVMWELHSQEVEVALYVRSLVTAEAHNAPTNTRTLVRQQMEALGISVPGMHRNKWKIADAAPEVTPTGPSRPSSRDRLHVVGA